MTKSNRLLMLIDDPTPPLDLEFCQEMGALFNADPDWEAVGYATKLSRPGTVNAVLSLPDHRECDMIAVISTACRQATIRDLATAEIRKVMDRTVFSAYNVLRAARGIPVFLLMPRKNGVMGKELAWQMAVGAATALENQVPNLCVLAGAWDVHSWGHLMAHSIGEHG